MFFFFIVVRVTQYKLPVVTVFNCTLSPVPPSTFPSCATLTITRLPDFLPSYTAAEELMLLNCGVGEDS